MSRHPYGEPIIAVMGPTQEDNVARHPHGQITQAQYERMAPSLSEADRATLRLLVGPARPVRASAPDDDDDLGEFAVLYPPRTRAEADRRRELAESIKASAVAATDDDELFSLLFGPEER